MTMTIRQISMSCRQHGVAFTNRSKWISVWHIGKCFRSINIAWFISDCIWLDSIVIASNAPSKVRSNQYQCDVYDSEAKEQIWKNLTKTLANRLSNSLWSGMGKAARLRTDAWRTWWFCCCCFQLFCTLFDGDVRLIVVVGVTFVTAVPASIDAISPLSLCVGDEADCAAVSRDDVKPIFVTLFLFSWLFFVCVKNTNIFFVFIVAFWPLTQGHKAQRSGDCWFLCYLFTVQRCMVYHLNVFHLVSNSIWLCTLNIFHTQYTINACDRLIWVWSHSFIILSVLFFSRLLFDSFFFSFGIFSFRWMSPVETWVLIKHPTNYSAIRFPERARVAVAVAAREIEYQH